MIQIKPPAKDSDRATTVYHELMKADLYVSIKDFHRSTDQIRLPDPSGARRNGLPPVMWR
jgi:hypothetical protein